MLEDISLLLQGLSISLQPSNLLACVIGVLIGTLVGVLPGIGTISAIALLLPFSYALDSTAALIMFAGIYYGSRYGGSTTSILMNVPGEVSSVVTCLDGYPMAKQGRAGAALAISAIGSFIAGTIGVIGLMLLAPPLAKGALAFGPPEYFSLALTGLIILAKLGGTSALKSALMATFGIMLGTVGMDGLSGISRFTFAFGELDRGLDISIIAMGLFGIGEVLFTLTQPNSQPSIPRVRFRDLYPTREEWKRSIAPILRGGITGFFIGLLPGPSGTISTFASYSLEKRCSKDPSRFGNGAIEGVAGPESANNAAISGTLIPLLSLGLPFCAATAILLSGFMIHGIIPGPSLINEHPDLFWGLIASMYVGNLLLLVINLPLIGIFVQLLRTPLNILMPLVSVITITGAYTINNSVADVIWVIGFGLLGFLFRRGGFDLGALVLGLVLGPEMERGLIQGLIIVDGSIWSLLTRPLSGTILALGALFLLHSAVKLYRSRPSHTRRENAASCK